MHNKNQKRISPSVTAAIGALLTLIGGLIGVISGYVVIPKIIIGVFNIIHKIPETVYSTNIMPIHNSNRRQIEIWRMLSAKLEEHQTQTSS